jgi:hypothetical protein
MSECPSNREQPIAMHLLVEPNINQLKIAIANKPRQSYITKSKAGQNVHPRYLALSPLSPRFFFSVPISLFFSPFPPSLVFPKWKDKPNTHSGNNNLLREAETKVG